MTGSANMAVSLVTRRLQVVHQLMAPRQANLNELVADLRPARAREPWSLADYVQPRNENRQGPREQCAGGQRPRQSSGRSFEMWSRHGM